MRKTELPVGFVIAFSLVILLIVLPLLMTFLSTSASQMASALSDPQVGRSIRLTLSSGAAATLLGLLIGLPAAWLLARYHFPGKHFFESLIDLPLVIPHSAAGIALLLVFGRKGLLGAPLSRLGLFFSDRPAGIVLGMLFVSVPLLINAAREAFAAIDSEIEHSARVDGASSWKIFWQVTLPLAWRGVISGAITMWARGISEFGAVMILAYNPKIIPVLIFERFQGLGLEAATPITALWIFLILVLFGVVRWLANSIDR
ncbi:MAG: ABC transporter permease [Anaerolineaceae bacterium]|jgi:molybdate/tungstate transport system permease protein